MPERRRLTRSTNRLIAGVCAGLADYLDLDATLVRIGFIVLALFSLGFGAIVAYVVCWAIMPPADAAAVAGPREAGARSGNAALLIGVILLVIGLSMLFPALRSAWWIGLAIVRFAWAIALIAAGVIIVALSRRR